MCVLDVYLMCVLELNLFDLIESQYLKSHLDFICLALLLVGRHQPAKLHRVRAGLTFAGTVQNI